MEICSHKNLIVFIETHPFEIALGSGRSKTE